jgi:vitamin B12 transporter
MVLLSCSENPVSLTSLCSAVPTLLLVLLLSPRFSSAEETVPEIFVTATRTAAPLESIGDSITLIRGADARSSQKTVLSDLLTTTPGISASRNGGIGTVTTVRIRGAEADQTVVLIDGVKLNDPSSPGGGFNFANLLVGDVERIEVLRGSQSTLWGSQAIGGVINIVTPQPQGPLRMDLASEAGSYGTASLAARAQAGSERFSWRVGANYLRTDGVSALDEDLGGREDDEYRQLGASLYGELRLSDELTAEVRSTWSRGRVDIDGFPPPSFGFADTDEFSTTREWVSYVGIELDTFEQRLQHRLGVSFTDTDRESVDPASSVPQTFDAFGRNVRVDYQGTWSVSERINGVFGIERERSELKAVAPSVFDPSPTPLREDVTLDSIYAQIQVTPVAPFTLTTGLRYDDHDTFGNDSSAQLAAAWSLNPATRLRASYGEGFKAPTLFQLFSPFGTRSLAPEESDDYDVGLEQRLFQDTLTLSATYFGRDTRSMIDFVSCFGIMSPRCQAQPDGFFENVQRTRANGYELGLEARPWAQLSATANYTYLEARNASPDSSAFGNQLARRPRHSANAQLSYAWRIPLTTTLAAQYIGRSFDDAANAFVLEEYTLVDVRAEYRLSDKVQIFGRVENLLDDDFVSVRGFGSIGRAGYVGVRITL